MNTKHTPGPWKLIGSCALGFTVHGKHECGDTDALAVCEGIKDRQCNEANARLMAAAPDLLEALQAVIEDWELTLKAGHAIQDSPCTRAIVHKALAKAKGEKQ